MSASERGRPAKHRVPWRPLPSVAKRARARAILRRIDAQAQAAELAQARDDARKAR